MAQFVVRDLENEVKAALKRRAKRRHHSMEEEVREILRDAVKRENRPTGGLGSEIAALFREIDLREEELRAFPRAVLKPMATDE